MIVTLVFRFVTFRDWSHSSRIFQSIRLSLQSRHVVFRLDHHRTVETHPINETQAIP